MVLTLLNICVQPLGSTFININVKSVHLVTTANYYCDFFVN